jgi:hypothetical protein
MMSRYCLRHSYRGSSRAWRIVLARHSIDRQAQQLIIDEHKDCPHCLTDTVEALADAAHSLLIRSGPIPEMDNAGNATGPTVDWILQRVDDHLACEQADRRDAG